MPATEFLDKIASRINRIDRKSLENCVVDLARERKFLTALLDQVPEGIMVLTLKKEILFLNCRMIQLFNIPEESTKKMGLSQIIPDLSFVELISNAITSKQELFQKEFETLLPRPMILRINLTHDKKQKPELFILSVANITQSEMNIREKFKVENWESMLGLSTGISH